MAERPLASAATHVPRGARVNRSRPQQKGLRGYDTHTRITGRTRPRLVDTRGLILAVVGTAARVQDRDGAKPRLAGMRPKGSRWRHLWAEGAEAGPWVEGVKALQPQRQIRLELTKRSDALKGVVVLPQRWMGERTSGECHRFRRRRQDDDRVPEPRETLPQVTMMPRRSHRIVLC
jgi:hypothetical protein